MKILLLNSGQGPDYLADLIISQLITCDNLEIYCNLLSDYLFSDFPLDIHLYGRGYTVFRQLNPELKKRVQILSEEELESYISQKYFDKIVYTSIRRRSHQAQNINPENPADYFDWVLQSYSKDNILAFDGEDETCLVESVVPYVTYYKRELLEQDLNRALPISFTFPSYRSVPSKIEKEYFLAPCDPRLLSSYRFDTESDYYLQYSKALFGFTKKKAGWDCMRHYEILACNCVPYFPDISEKPIYTMKNYPVKLQQEANQLFEKMILSLDSFEIHNFHSGRMHRLEQRDSEYQRISNEFQTWFESYGKSNVYENLIL